MADDDPWLLKEDGYLKVDVECKNIIYHPNLNVLLITTGTNRVFVFDVNLGIVLHRSRLSGKSDGKLQGVYLAEGVDKILYTDGRGIGVRSDYNGVLLLDTMLQIPVSKNEDSVKIELLLSEAFILHQCLRCIELPGVEHVQEVLQELWNKIISAQSSKRYGIKAQKWNTVCLDLPHAALKQVCSSLVMELKKQNKHIPALPIASAISERLNTLLPSIILDGGPADKALMFSEAARRETFSKWPHMNYNESKSRNNVLRWALPGQMAQAGFYHEPNNTAEDRAMCFTCNVCLVCWEPTDEPWSEHERHSPACPFVKGEYTQNVPMSVTLATAPAREASDTVEVIGTTNVAGLAATASYNGLVNVWNISGQLKGEMTFYVSVTDQESNNKESHKFYGVRNLSSQYLSALTTEGDSSDYKSSPSTTHKLHLTSMSLLGSPKLTSNEFNQGSTTSKALESEQRDPSIRPCLACGITVYSTAGQRTLDNVWSSTDLAPSASLVRAMNNVNSATSDSLDIMKVAGEKNNSLPCHYIVLYDFHHKATVPMQPAKDEPSKGTKTKKAPSGTGTSASSTGGRQESIYSEFYMSKLLYDAPVIEDVDSEMVVGAHFDGLFTTTCLTASSSNALYAPPFSYSVAPSTTSPYDTNFNPMNGSDQFASTSELGKKSIEMTNKSIKADPIVLQTIPIEAHPSLRITYTGPTKDGKYLFVAMTPIQQLPIMSSTASGNANKMDIDEESELFSQKSCMYWDQNYGGNKLINGDTQHTQSDSSLLLVYTLDFTDKVPKLVSEPLLKRELTLDQTPIEIVFLPLQDKHKSLSPNKPHGQVALVCRDGIVRVIDLSTLKIINEARSENEKFISVAYCNRLERLCACTSTGSLRFFAMTDEDESTDEKDDLEDISMMTESTSADNVIPSTSTSTQPEPMIAQRSNLSYIDLKTLYDLTKLDKHSPAYSATVPACWSEMMQAQRQRRYPQHLHQSEDQHHTRTWRLQNDATTWDEHIFELTLPRNVAGIVGQVDVRFTLHTPCLDPPNVQVTLLKQNLVGMCHRRTPRTSVDERINFNISGEQKGENPITSEEYQRQHNTQILCGPINLKRCLDLSDHSGCITLTSPKLFRTKARTLLVHLKALKDPAKEGESSKARGNVETKPPTSKKLRIDEAGPFLPGATVERIAAASANKKLEYYIGCDWIHEISITVRCVQNTELTNQRLQRLMMLESIPFTRNLLNVACLEGLEKTLACQSLALDILVWVTSIRLARLRLSHNVMDSRALQLDTIRCIQEKLHTLLKTCILDAGRSIAHKCVKLIIICSEGLRNSEDGAAAHSFDDAVLSVIVSLMPSVIGIQWAGSLRWLAVLITRLMPLDKTHSMTQQCINILQLISEEMTNRVNPYHLLLATRFGLYNNPFETELFDMEPPVPPKFNSLPVTYASIVTGSEQTTSTNSMNPQYSQDHIDLRDLLTLPTNPGSELVVPSKLKALCTNHNMKGLLEVEPLHYICHAASDGTKMEKIDAPVNSNGGLFDGSGASDLKIPQSAEDMNFPWSRLLSWPSQQALVVERMHSGARRFVVLDFGSPILLTDLIIPSCSDLVSLSIDIWTKSEEIDGTRLVVAGDIGTKPLVVNDLQPPPVCRFLKITTIGRYGMTTTRCKIPIGTFYGHMFVLPGEDYSEMSQGDTNLVTTIESQCSILSALVEDVQCRFSLATERLKGLLEPLLCSETPNVVHMQHYLCKGRAESRGQPSNKILTTYHECIMFQHQLNVVRGVWRRLETWKDPTAVHNVDISNVPSDKLRILGEMLHDVLLYTMYEIGPVPPVPNSLCDIFTPAICEKFFHSVCVVTPAPRLQLHAAALLARMAGHQSWWGDFLANTLVNLYSTSSTHIFPQDRVFILLTFLGRKSLIAGANKSSVVEAMVKTLGKLLSPLSNDQGSVTTRLDTTLISWVLLFLSVCLDTTANHSTSTDEQSDKSKEQAIPSRWEFLQGESAMQRKYVSASRSSASRNYRKKIQKRLMHHKQQLQDIEQAKKGAQSPSAQSHAWSSMTQLPAVLTTKLEVLKSHERHLKKTLKQHSAFKHFKDMLRRNDQPHSSRRYHASPGARTDAQDIDLDTMVNLSHQHVLPVARGLIELILNHSANVDMFLLACKVVARLVVSTRPFINLGDLMTEEQLLKLMKLATSNSDTAWSSHAISCLLQDLLEGGRLFPKSSPVQESQSDEQFETNDDLQTGDDDLSGVAGNSGSSTTLGNDEGFADGDGEDTQDSIAAAAPVTPSTSKLNGFELSSFLESDDSELEEFLDDILERGRNMLKKGSAITKLPPSASSGISLALDARLEYGVEMGVEIALRRYSTLGAYNLPLAINATIQPPQVDAKASTSRGASSSASWSPPEPSATSLSMLTRCFDRIFMDLALQSSNSSLEQVLQFWLTLNLDASGESSSSPNFDTSLTPVIPLRPAAISSLISAFLWSSGVTLKAWCLLLQTLTLCSNEIMSPNPDDSPIEGLLGGMASILVKDRNMGPMLLKLLSGNGLNVDTKDKQFIMAGPRVGFALQDFLVRLEMRCDVITPDSSLGNSMKELLLQVLYQLVQPGGALEARRGPLDAQCILITQLNNLNFINTDLGTAMSITECVGVIISSYVKEARVGVQCSGAVDTSGQSIGFGGLFSSVLGSGGNRQGKPTNWDSLVIALIKLVSKLVQTPLPSRRTSTIDMEIGYSAQRQSELDNQKLGSQTDESKAAEQTTMRHSQGAIPKPKYPCVADTVLQHEPTMMRLLGALGMSTSSSLGMLIGEDSVSTPVPEIGDALSVADVTFQLLVTLMKKATTPNLVLNPLYRYLSSTHDQLGGERKIMQLSEPLLWYILKVLDNETALSIFTSMGGIRVLCENMVKCSTAGQTNTGLSTPGVISLVMQHLSNTPNLPTMSSSSSAVPATSTTTTNTTSSSNKKSSGSLESHDDGLLNFAPLGTISWMKPMVEPADVLIQSATPHRRARTAAWSYHFFPGEAWIDLTISLPCAILLREVELQPHLTSLATCPSAVSLEISRDGSSDLMPVCPPMLTAGLTFIKLTLSQPEVMTSILIRLYKPRDSPNISLSQIRLLGTTAFGEVKSKIETVDEEQLTKSSLGWLRLLHQCLSVSSLSPNLSREVLNSAASVDGLVEACCSLLLHPAPSLFTPNLEKVLLQLGLHSNQLGLRLINLLLNNRCTPLIQNTSTNQKSSTIQLIVELLQQLCASQDAGTEARVSAVLNWLYTSAMAPRNHQNNPNFISPPAIYIHCISTIIWKSHELSDRAYNLDQLLTNDLFNSLYQWTLGLERYSALKQAIDACLCAFCYVKPSLFPLLLQHVKILIPNLATDHSASISDDRKENECQTDDRKSETNEEWYGRLQLPNYKCLQLTDGQLLTVAAAARSNPGIIQLIDSGLPGLLVNMINEFCLLQNGDNVNKNESGKTDSDKADEVLRKNNTGLNMTDPDGIATVLEFLTLVCTEGKMRDWLGSEGGGFWFVLAELLGNRPVENPRNCFARMNVSYTRLESSMIKFLSRCCWCHPNNQKLLAELLTNVILKQRTSSNVRYLHGISGFTRRLILQLLLESEKILVSIGSDNPMNGDGGSNALPSMPPHPAHPHGHYHQLLYISTQSTVGDILQQISGTWPTLLLQNTNKDQETNKNGSNRSRELWESGMALVVDTLSVAAGNTAKDKRAKEASNRSQARGPILRKSRLGSDGPSTSKGSTSSSQGVSVSSLRQEYLIHPSRPNTPLPSQLTIGQLLALIDDSGVSLSEPCIHLILRQKTKDTKDDVIKFDDNNLIGYKSIESALGVFSAGGGLAVLAKHLPLVYPDTGRTQAFPDKTISPEQNEAEWVKVEASEDIYEEVEEAGATASPRATPPTPHVPFHSLAAFGIFLRLPGYAEVLLRDRKQAQCLLRLALGVTDDGEGGDILSSPLASALPTLPFQVLKQLLEATPPTTDDGQLLRRTMVDIGAVLLLLNCLAIFTHQTGYSDSGDPRPAGSGRSDDKSHLYWAKGTGFGTGSTQQSWNVEQALLRQRSEEEHVTVLLTVLASYIGQQGTQPERELPSTFGESLLRSCLLPALSSYLRNDSVLDMARHIPLYRAVLQLLRSIALSPQLVPLLLPRATTSNDPSIVSLLSSMKTCVDNYVHKINRTKGNKSKSTTTKYPDDIEQDEGLATLIPDIQESAGIVKNATIRIGTINEDTAGPSPSNIERPLKSTEERYLEVMRNLQFDTFEMICENSDGNGYKFVVSYHFESNMRAAGERCHPVRVKRLAQEAVTLSSALPLSYSSSVFVRCDADRLDIMKVLITGPAETPYANGCFEFDVYFPPDYPRSPMMINLETTGRHTVRFNPNLYNDGKVCLSILNTWHGRPEEKWNSHTSSFLQVLVSIQSLILVPEPYFNEPGYERSRGTSSGAQSSQEYNANVCLATVKWAMLDQIVNPCPCFKEVIHKHFWIKRHEIVAQLESWIMDMEMYASDRRLARTISLNALALRRHYRLLRDALNKIPTPEGLEDLAGPLPPLNSNLEVSSSGTPVATTPTPTTPTTSSTNMTPISMPLTNSGLMPINNPTQSTTNNHVHHDIDTDVEMEKMVSKVCE